MSNKFNDSAPDAVRNGELFERRMGAQGRKAIAKLKPEASVAAGAVAMASARARGPQAPKLAGIQALMAAGDWRGAILAAARLPNLGDERDAILRAKEAITNPAFQRQLKRDPEALVAAGVAALKGRFGQ